MNWLTAGSRASAVAKVCCNALLLSRQFCLSTASLISNEAESHTLQQFAPVFEGEGGLPVAQNQVADHRMKCAVSGVASQGYGPSDEPVSPHSDDAVLLYTVNPFFEDPRSFLLPKQTAAPLSAGLRKLPTSPAADKEQILASATNRPNNQIVSLTYPPKRVGLLPSDDPRPPPSAGQQVPPGLTESHSGATSQLSHGNLDLATLERLNPGDQYSRLVAVNSEQKFGTGQPRQSNIARELTKKNSLTSKRKRRAQSKSKVSSGFDQGQLDRPFTGKRNTHNPTSSTAQLIPSKRATDMITEEGHLTAHVKQVIEHLQKNINPEAVDKLQGLERFLKAVELRGGEALNRLCYLFGRASTDQGHTEGSLPGLSESMIRECLSFMDSYSVLSKRSALWLENLGFPPPVALAIQGQLGRELCQENGLASRIDSLSAEIDSSIRKTYKNRRYAMALSPEMLFRESMIVVLYKIRTILHLSSYLKVPVCTDIPKGLEDAFNGFEKNWIAWSNQNIGTHMSPRPPGDDPQMVDNSYVGKYYQRIVDKIFTSFPWYDRVKQMESELLRWWMQEQTPKLPMFGIIQNSRHTSKQFETLLSHCVLATWFGHFPSAAQLMKGK